MSRLAVDWDPRPFSVRREDAGRVPVLVVAGGLHGATAPELSAAVCAFGGEKVVVDLCDVGFVDADGLRDLLLAARVLGVALHVVSPEGAPVRRVLERAHAIRALTLHESRHEALRAVSWHPRSSAARDQALFPHSAI